MSPAHHKSYEVRLNLDDLFFVKGCLSQPFTKTNWILRSLHIDTLTYANPLRHELDLTIGLNHGADEWLPHTAG